MSSHHPLPTALPAGTAAPSATALQQWLDAQPMNRLRWQVVLLCAAAVFFDGYDLQVMALTVPALARAWQVPAPSFGVALAALGVGVTLGAALLAPLSDRIGRRPVLIAALTLVGLATLGTTTAASASPFVVWRLLTGLGLGTCLPVCNAWTAEYAPARRRGLTLVAMNAAIGIGAFGAGMVVPALIERWGWPAAFHLGGVAPLVLAAAVALGAPESLKFLLARRPTDRRIPALLRQMGRDAAPIATGVDSAPPPAQSVRTLLTPEYRARTLMLWSVQLFNRFTLHLLTAWLPTLLLGAGWPLATASKGAVMVQGGGVVGGLCLSFYLDRGRAVSALRAAFAAAAACLLLFLFVPAGWPWFVLLALIGVGSAGAQLALNALSTAYYPSAIKATGMGWAGVMSGWGSMAAPMVGAWLIGLGLGPQRTLAWIAVPVLLCATLSWGLRQRWQAH